MFAFYNNLNILNFILHSEIIFLKLEQYYLENKKNILNHSKFFFNVSQLLYKKFNKKEEDVQNLKNERNI